MGTTRIESGTKCTSIWFDLVGAIMHTSHDEVNSCTTLGHIYSSCTVIRCLHRESWSMRVATWRDNDTDAPELLFEEDLEFGPFDPMDFVSAEVLRCVNAAMDAQIGCSSL